MFAISQRLKQNQLESTLLMIWIYYKIHANTLSFYMVRKYQTHKHWEIWKKKKSQKFTEQAGEIYIHSLSELDSNNENKNSD